MHSGRYQFLWITGLIIVGLMLIISAVGLIRPVPNAGKSSSRVITDMTGRTVHVPANPQRILSLCTSATDTLLALGQRDRLAAIDQYSRIIPMTGAIPAIGQGSAISREQVVALQIDLAIIWWYQDDAAAMLETLNVPVIRLQSARAAQIPAIIQLIGQITDCSSEAEMLSQQLETFLAAQPTTPANDITHAAVDPNQTKVFLELYGPYKTAGEQTYANDLLMLAGARNIAADSTGNVLFSPERLLRENPDVILFVDEFATVSDYARRSGLSGVSAVQHGRVIPINRYWLVAGPHLPDAVAQLRQLLEVRH